MRWREQFTAAAYAPGPWGTGNLTQEEISPEDLVLHLVRYYLLQDAKLKAIFSGPDTPNTGDLIEALEGRNPLDFRPFARLQLYLGQSPMVQTPTRIDDRQVTVIVSVRWGMVAGLEPVPFGKATVASVLSRCRLKLLNGAAAQLLTTVGGVEAQLARRVVENPVNYIYDVDDKAGVQAQQELPLTYYLFVDHVTQKIRNVALAGG